MSCLRCGSARQWEQDQRFCSASCRGRYYDDADATPRDPPTLDEIVCDILIEDYYTRVPDDHDESHAEIYVIAIRDEAWTRRVKARAINAAMGDFGPEHPPVERTPMQERLRVAIREFIKPRFRTDQELRSDAYARVMVDAVEWWIINQALEKAKRGPPALSQSARYWVEHSAQLAEERWRASHRPKLRALYPV